MEEIEYTWHNARDWCMANGGDLASFHNADEHAFVTDWVSVIAFSMKTLVLANFAIMMALALTPISINSKNKAQNREINDKFQIGNTT